MPHADTLVLRRLARHRALAHLAATVPERVPGWDAIVLSAGSEAQAALYRRQLDDARDRGLVARGTRLLAVPDRGAARIGSGGATLEALRVLAADAPERDWHRARVLLIHAGGHSKRTPWANVLGKPFVPLPLHADPDRACPALIDHILASAAPLARDLALRDEGGLAVLTGDVLAVWDGSLGWRDGVEAVVLTTAVPLDTAGRHGVIVPGAHGAVADLLQKPDPVALETAGALVDGGAALLDTGLFAFRGRTWAGLLALATSDADPVARLVEEGVECSLYEEIAGALVEARHRATATRPLGRDLIAALGACRMHHHRRDDLAFLHFGTSAEYLGHLGHRWDGALPARLLVEGGHLADDRAVLAASRVRPGASVGPGTVVIGSDLGPRARIGTRCLLLGIEAGDGGLHLGDHLCLWQVPVRHRGTAAMATCLCGVDDDPKSPAPHGTVAGQGWPRFLAGHAITAEECWPDDTPHDLWHARIHPLLNPRAALGVVTWLAADTPGPSPWAARWRAAPRVSLAELHAIADTTAFHQRLTERRAALATTALRSTITAGLHRNLAALAAQIPAATRGVCRDLAAMLPVAPETEAAGIPASRLAAAERDLRAASGDAEDAAHAEARAFTAIIDAVDTAIAHPAPVPVTDLAAGARVTVALPARFDLAGGWSDTPPYCLEHPARVLNLAIHLDGRAPLQATAEALDEPVVELRSVDGGDTCRLHGTDLDGDADLGDRFLIAKQALYLCGYATPGTVHQGVRLTTASQVPRGSGLGASSILAAATLAALQGLAGRADDPATVSSLVLALEQRMRTGGGWQDQIGGLYPGAKVASSTPTRPLRLRVEPVPVLDHVRSELETRLVLVYTGQQRLARNVLQIVVGRYLSRDRTVVDTIGELAELADAGRRALARGHLDDLGRIMAAAWHGHQRLDPRCSNPAVDALLESLTDYSLGWKLAGAGGGGFAAIMAKDAEAATHICAQLEARNDAVAVRPWRLAVKPAHPTSDHPVLFR